MRDRESVGVCQGSKKWPNRCHRKLERHSRDASLLFAKFYGELRARRQAGGTGPPMVMLMAHETIRVPFALLSLEPPSHDLRWGTSASASKESTGKQRAEQTRTDARRLYNGQRPEEAKSTEPQGPEEDSRLVTVRFVAAGGYVVAALEVRLRPRACAVDRTLFFFFFPSVNFEIPTRERVASALLESVDRFETIHVFFSRVGFHNTCIDTSTNRKPLETPVTLCDRVSPIFSRTYANSEMNTSTLTQALLPARGRDRQALRARHAGRTSPESAICTCVDF